MKDKGQFDYLIPPTIARNEERLNALQQKVSCRIRTISMDLTEMVSMDEGAAYLGEVALVPYSSPINKSGVLFFNTLFDENAACHLALGRGFSNCLKDYEKYSHEEAKEAGINDSMIHEDFMIGAVDTKIVGYDANGNEHIIFDQGEWAF